LPAQDWALDSQAEVRRAVVPIYLRAAEGPAVVIRADHVFNDYQRRGFFRIGVLPLCVLDGVSVEVRETNQIAAALSRASESFAARGSMSRAVEARNFSISFPNQKSATMKARRVCFEKGDEWWFEEGILRLHSGECVSLQTARLVVRGPAAGDLIYAGRNGPVRFNLISSHSTEENEPKTNHEKTPGHDLVDRS
jgi:hypothetical protein